MTRHELTDIEAHLVDASNALRETDRDVKDHHRYAALDKAIDDALRLVQTWKEEAGA